MLGHPGQHLIVATDFMTVGFGSILKQPGKMEQVLLAQDPLVIEQLLRPYLQGWGRDRPGWKRISCLSPCWR